MEKQFQIQVNLFIPDSHKELEVYILIGLGMAVTISLNTWHSIQNLKAFGWSSVDFPNRLCNNSPILLYTPQWPEPWTGIDITGTRAHIHL